MDKAALREIEKMKYAETLKRAAQTVEVDCACSPTAEKMAGELRIILEQLRTLEGREKFLRGIYGSLARLDDRIEELQEITLATEREKWSLVSYYVAIGEDTRAAMIQLRQALRAGGKSYEIEAQIIILSAQYKKLLDMTQKDVARRSESAV